MWVLIGDLILMLLFLHISDHSIYNAIYPFSHLNGLFVISSSALFAHYLADDGSLACPGIEINQDNLLPSTEA